MRALLVVPLHPRPNDAPRLLECPKYVLLDALLLQTAEEPLDDPILFRCIRRDELLLQPIVPTGVPKPPTLKDQAVIAAQYPRPHGSQRPEPGQASGFHRALGLLRATPERELVPNDFPIMTVDHRAARCAQLSWPHGICVTSMAHRSLLRLARLIQPCTRGRGVATR